ncbi:MAG: adenine nucleotide alpha hydrolase family protein [Caldisericia bacterium]|nr:adenine nucleotide alpha hydrolase family protein [Caldisericia bacterium]
MNKCIRCKKEAAVFIDNLRFCKECFIIYFENNFLRGVNGEGLGKKMLTKDEKVLVAVSGGKDSMTLWYLLSKFGFNVTGVHIDLNYENFSKESENVVKSFSLKHSLPLMVFNLKSDFNIDMKEVFLKNKNREPCSVCGTIKRYLLNKIAYDYKFDAVATGHNLDDGVAVIFKALLNWDIETLSRNYPILDSDNKLIKKVKPLFRLQDKEIKYYAEIMNIEHTSLICPYKKGKVTLSKTKEVLEIIDKNYKGIKRGFYFGFLRNKNLFEKEKPVLFECKICGMPTTNENICNFCKLTKKDNL